MGLNYVAKLDVNQAIKDAKRLEAEIKRIGGVSMSSNFDTKPMSAFQQGVFTLKKELQEKDKVWKELRNTEAAAKSLSAEHKATVDALKVSEQELNNQLKAGKLTLEEYNLEQKKLVDAQKLAFSAQKEADRQAGEANKRLREQLALERQAEAQKERNRKKLQQESSEYFQLNKALNAVRGRAKDVLAAMFDLERQGKKNSAEYKALEQRSKSLVSQTNILDKGIKGIDATLGLHQRHVGDYGRAIEGLSPHFAAINSALSVFGTSIDQLAGAGGMASFGTQIAAVGKNILAFLISPIGLVITALTALYGLFVSNKDTVIEFDDKLLDVGKTTGLAGRNLTDLGTAVIELSKKLETVSAAKLLEYATVAGSLGVSGTKDILAFSEALAKLEIASNIEGEEGAAEIARLLTLTDGGVQNVKAFGDEIVNLGNAFAATEAEILSNAEQISQNTGLYKLSRQEVLAYATATKSVGLEAEVVGSAFARTLSTFEKAIRTGQNISEISKATGLSVDELRAKFKNDAGGVFNDFIKGLNAVDKSGGSVNGVLENLGITAVRDQRVISTLATSGYDVLARSIDVVKSSSGALQTEFDTASGKLVNQTAKFGIAWDNLVLSIENGQGIIGRSSAAVVGFFTSIVEAVTPSTRTFEINEEAAGVLTKRYDELTRKGQLLGGSFKLSKDEQEELRKVTAQIGELIPGVITQFDKYGNALDINRQKVDQMTKAQRELFSLQNKGDVASANKRFNDALLRQQNFEKQALAISARGGDNAAIGAYQDYAKLASGDAYKEAVKIRDLGGTINKQQKELLDYYEKQDKAIVQGGKSAADAGGKKNEIAKRTIPIIEEEIKALKEQQDTLDINSKAFQRNRNAINKLQKELNDANGKETKVSNTGESILKQQRAVQAEIDAITKKGRAKKLSDDEQDLADIDIKYEKIIRKATEFNKNSKNKGLKVDLGGILVAQTSEREAKIDDNKAKQLKLDLAKEKELYTEFEQFKSDFGLAKAKERYKDLINVESSYQQEINKRIANLSPDEKAKGGNEAGAYSKEQLKVLEDASNESLKIEQKRTDALLKQFMAYADKRKNLTEQYEADLLLIGNNEGAKSERTKAYNEDLKQLDDANSKKLDSYEKLFIGIDKLSTRNALKVVDQARRLLAKDIKDGILTPAQIKEINDLLNKTEIAIRGKSGQALIDLAGAINSVASSVGDLDEEFGKVLGTVGIIVGQVGNIKKGFADFKAAGLTGDTLGQLGAGLGIVGAGVSIFSSVIKMFDKSAQREEQAGYARDLQNKQTEALNKALERQVALLDEVYGTEKVKKYDEAIKQARDNQAKYTSELAGKYSLTGDKGLDAVIEKINSNQKLSYDERVVRNALEKNGALKELPTDITSLQRLLDEGKLDAATATIVTNLLKAVETAEQLANNLRAENVGTTLGQIADDFISTLTDGTQDFGKTFEKTMQKSILNGFKGELIRKQLQAFYEQFAKLSEGGLTSSEIDALRKTYIDASEKAKADLTALSKATGIDLTGDAAKSTSTQSAATGIGRAGLSEETGSRIDGIMRAQYDATKLTNTLLTPIGKSMGDLYLIAKGNFDVQLQIEQNTARTANNTDLLNTKLDAIITNTKQPIGVKGI